MTKKDIFAIRLTELRKEFKLTQQKLAEKINVSRSSVVQYEAGEKSPRYDVLLKIASLFGVSIDFLLGNIDIRARFPEMFEPEEVKPIPVLGEIHAGKPVFAQENIEKYITVPVEWIKGGEYFLLRVKGKSMEPEIKENSLVLVKRQNDVLDREIAVVLLSDGEAVIKRVFKNNGKVILQSDNPEYKPIIPEKNELIVLGLVKKTIKDVK